MAKLNLTRKQLFTQLLELDEVQANPDFVAGLQSCLNAVEKKASKGVSDEVLKARQELDQKVLGVLSKPMTVTEVVKALFSQGTDVSNSMVTSRLTDMVKRGLVVRELVDRKPFFSKVEKA